MPERFRSGADLCIRVSRQSLPNHRPPDTCPYIGQVSPGQMPLCMYDNDTQLCKNVSYEQCRDNENTSFLALCVNAKTSYQFNVTVAYRWFPSYSWVLSHSFWDSWNLSLSMSVVAQSNNVKPSKCTASQHQGLCRYTIELLCSCCLPV